MTTTRRPDLVTSDVSAARESEHRKTLTRRKILELGLASGSAAFLIAGGASTLSADHGANECANDMPNDLPAPLSPPVTPFVVPMPVPAVLAPSALNPAPTQSANTAAGEAQRADHQRWSQFLPQATYDMHVQEFSHTFHPAYPTQPVWGFNGSSPGPTVIARYGEPALVRLHNDLPPNHVGFGDPHISIHLHNGHTASESDGNPADFFAPGLFKDNHYANVLAGFSLPGFAPTGDPDEAMNTLWYHDHRVNFTAQNTYKGLAGFYLLFDSRDSGDENDPAEDAFHLPSGDYDVPIFLQDKAFDADGFLRFDTSNTDGLLGDRFLANGVIQPFFQVQRRKYRFRILNGGPSRFYELFLSSGQHFLQISNDGNLLPAPIPVESVLLGVATRFDVIVDFSQSQIGDHVFLQNRLDQCSGFGPSGSVTAPGTSIIRFDVVADPPTSDNSQVPATLRTLPPVPRNNDHLRERDWSFDNEQGAWMVNGRFFDPNRVDARIPRNTAEIWRLKNGSNWSHPIHIHLEEVQILSLNGRPPTGPNVARKDVIVLGPGDDVKVYVQFRDWLGKYVMHCHNTVHEDHAMMIRFDVV